MDRQVVPKRRYLNTKLRSSNILEHRGSQVCKSSIKIKEVLAALRESNPPVTGPKWVRCLGRSERDGTR